MCISMDLPDLQFSSKIVIDTKEYLFRKISRYLEDTRVLECVCGYQSEVTECMALGDSNWPEIVSHAVQQRQCWGPLS